MDVKLIVDKKINKFFNNNLKLAKELDWKTEYLDAKLSIKSVKMLKKQFLIYLNMEQCIQIA